MGTKNEFSIVVTVFQEAHTIEALLLSLIKQSYPPYEIIVVDAGSTDETIDIIQNISKHSPIPIRLYIEQGANRSEGRNVGIKHAKSEFMAVTDAGCIADPEWLETLSQGFLEQNVDVVAGHYDVLAHTRLQEAFSWFMAIPSEKLVEKTYLPSSRSLAFSKTIWEKIGGYPEKLSTCEDLVFASRLKQYGHMLVEPEARVQWLMPPTYSSFFRQIMGYAAGDIEALYMPHVIRHLTVWLRYALFLVIPILIFIYPLYPLWKMRQKTLSVTDGLMVIQAQLLTDVGIMAGGITGLWKRFRTHQS